MSGSAPYLHTWYDERKDNMDQMLNLKVERPDAPETKEWDLIMSVRVTEDMLEGTTFEEIAETIKDSAEKSGYIVYDQFYEEVNEDE